MEKHDLLVLNELTESGSNLRPSIQVEHALAEIKDSYQTPPLAKIPFTEIAALGGSFAGVVETMATPAAEGLYRCVFPKGITGTLAMAKDGSGALGTIMNDGIVGQARWIPVDKAIGPACFKAALVAVAVLAVVKQVQDTLFVITTDGMENASRHYNAERVKQMIERQKARYGWEFLFLGANIDAVETARHFGIGADRAVNYHSDSAGTQLNYEVLSEAICAVRGSVQLGADWKKRIDEDFESRGTGGRNS